MNKVNMLSSVLIVLSMFSFTACGDANSPAFYAGDRNKTEVSKATLQVAKSEQGFLREKDEQENPEDFQNSPDGMVFTTENMFPAVKIEVSEMLNGEIQIMEVLN